MRPIRARLSADAAVVAPTLLGAQVVSTIGGERVVVRLTEVEAYGGVGEDPGSHAYRGRTARNSVMFGPAGHLYVYFTYGMHWCANVVCGPDGSASAVLLRAGEVVEGLDVARSRRAAARTERDLARGPARLAQALGLTGEVGGADLLDPTSQIRLLPGVDLSANEVRSGPRVGVRGDGASTPWRFWLDGDPTVSPYRPAASRAPG